MKDIAGIFLTCALLTASVPLSSKAADQEQKAAAGPEQSEYETSGEIEVGWRSYIKRPPSGYEFGAGGVPLTANQTESRAKFEQYGEIRPGLFLDYLYTELAKKDGSFTADLSATNVGFNNQNYFLRLSEPGKTYLTAEWDQTPHLYSTGAKTLFDNSNPSVLTISPAVRTALEADPSLSGRQAIVNANLRPIELGIQRDTAKFGNRWTPTPEWDFKANYSRERRTGTRAFAVAMNGFNSIEALEPVATTTQNFDFSGQYFGTGWWGKKFSANLQYAGSIFDNDFDSVTFDNPFKISAPTPGAGDQGRASLPPSNYAHRLAYTTGIDLPFDSRYMGTVSYNTMRQNQAFIPSTINAAIAPSVAPLPASSLNGRIDTLLLNNVLTTRLTSDLTSTLRYRYYNNDNRTPSLLFRDYVRADGGLVPTDRSNLPVKYRRDNAGADLNWNALKWLKTGISYGMERYDRDLRDTDITIENSGKIFVDANPWDWVRLRSSYLLGQRRYNVYDGLNNVGIFAYPPNGEGGTGTQQYVQNLLMRKFEMANRDRNKVDLSAEFTTPIQGLIVTPSFSWRNDKYEDNLATGGTLGLKRDKYWNLGIEVAYALNSSTTFMVAYLREMTNRTIVNMQRSAPPCNIGPTGDPSCYWGSQIDDTVHTVMSSVNFEVIPNSLDLKLGYTYSQAKDITSTYALGSANITSSPPFPDVNNFFHRLDAEAKYKLEQDLVRQLGWKGDIIARFRYAYERNQMTNWAIDTLTPMMTGANSSLFLASINPNYKAQLLTFSLGFKW